MERLQKFLASSNIASRRKSEELILAGKIRVNGQVITELGTKVDPEKDTVEYQGQRVQSEALIVYAFYKPVGVTSTTADRHADKKVVEFFPSDQRIYPIGRLDKDSEGLMLVTNDGSLAQQLTHPKYAHEKEYEVTFQGDPTQIARLSQKHILDGSPIQPMTVAAVKRTAPNEFKVVLVLKEGRKRQIRRVAERIKLKVRKLKRTRIGKLGLGTLKPGEWRRVRREAII